MVKKFKSQIQFLKDQRQVFTLLKTLNFAFLLIGFLYANTLLIYDGKNPVNLFNLFVFIILIQVLGLAIGFLFLDKIEKNFIFKLFSKISKKVLSIFGVLPELITPNILKKEFLINGIIFNCGVLLSFIVNVSFFDIVFGWSSSLKVDSFHIKVFTDIISTPWNWFFESARPSLELVEKSQYFRVNSKFTANESSIIDNYYFLSQWWKFFVCSVITYGILPRLGFLYYFLQKNKNEPIESNLDSIFKVEGGDVSELFILEDREEVFLYSILNFVLLEDLKKINKSHEKRKQWYELWKSELKKNMEFLSFDELREILIDKRYSQNIKILTIFCEALTFEPYITDDGQTVAKLDKASTLDFLNKVMSLNSFQGHELYEFSNKLEQNLSEDKSLSFFPKLLGLALLSSAVIAFTGGVGAGVLIGKALGLMTIAGKVTGAVLISGGLLQVVGKSEESEKIFMGCGQIFSGIKGAINEGVMNTYLSSQLAIVRDLKKLETFVDLKFFDESYYKAISHSILIYLESFEKEIKIDKLKEKEFVLKLIEKINHKVKNF